MVNGERLRRFMSEPSWTAAQKEVADLTCAAVETSLEGALFGTYITPRPYAETARIIADGGIVDTAYPVYRVTALDGAAVPQPAEGEPAVLPADYELRGHRLHHLPATDAAGLALASGWPFIAPAPRPAGQLYAGAVRISYLAGWGPEDGLVLAILRKAQTLMGNRHSDTVTVRGLSASAPPKLSPETWTDAELKPLGRYRRLGVGSR